MILDEIPTRMPPKDIKKEVSKDGENNQFFKRIDWKKFIKYEVYCFLIVTVLYVFSVARKANVFPENIYVIPLITGIFGVMMLLKSHTAFIGEEIFKKQ